MLCFNVIKHNSFLLQNNKLETSYSLHLPYQYLVVKSTSILGEGKNYTLMTKYKSELTDGLGGLYRSSYTDEDGNVKSENFLFKTMQTTASKIYGFCVNHKFYQNVFNLI